MNSIKIGHRLKKKKKEKKEENPSMRPYRVCAPADAGAVAVTGEEVGLFADGCSPGRKVCSETGEH